MAEYDDICEIIDGICKRHKVAHEGRYYNLSQEKSSVGHDYRKKWDKEFVGEIIVDDICEIVDGICKRHKVAHEGRHYNLSQEKSIRGWKVRKYWDSINNGKKDCGCNKKKGKLH